MAEYDTKSVLLDLMKEGENKSCIDCGVPMPQWASLSFGVFCCLTCSGAHRGLGVHISFVRSLTMDKWTEAQLTKMRVGGNEKCRIFFEQSPGYSSSMSIQDKYTSHFATQYKDKLLAEIEGRTWVPSDTAAPVLPSSSSLRKPRTTGVSRTSSPLPRSESPLSPGTAGGSSNPFNNTIPARTANETYFSSMGQRNEMRPSGLPPSQGGKYAGFGSDSGYTPSNATSSRALPGLDDFRDDPVSALGRGWGFLGAALSQASRSINETVVQPTLERAVDPTLQSQLSSYVSKASSVLGEASRRGGEALAAGLHTGGDLLRRDLGVNVGDLGAGYVERVTGRGAGGGYGQVGTFEVPSADAQEHGDADFFGDHLGQGGATSGVGQNSSPAAFQDSVTLEDGWAKMAPQSTGARGAAGSSRAAVAKKAGSKKDSDNWDDFGEEKW